MGAIVAMTFSMMAVYAGESDQIHGIHILLQKVFTGLFMIEAVAKLTAYRFKYFKSGWNKFDFLLVILSTVSYFAD